MKKSKENSSVESGRREYYWSFGKKRKTLNSSLGKMSHQAVLRAQ
jgi:hypothetical protein